MPANEEVHIWCEIFDLLKGDFFRVRIINFGCLNKIIILLRLQIKGVTEKLYGTFADGIGEILPASSEARTLKVQFRSNKKKNAGGFRCQVCLQCGSLFSFSNDFLRLLLLLKLLGLGLEP